MNPERAKVLTELLVEAETSLSAWKAVTPEDDEFEKLAEEKRTFYKRLIKWLKDYENRK